MAAHRFWRLYVTSAQSSSETDLTELYLCSTAGGASVATGGTASADTIFSGVYVAANAFDGADGTSWASSGTSMPHWLAYDFGVGNAQDIVQYGIKSILTGGYTTFTPKDFQLQYSDDGTNWTTRDTVAGATGWTAGETRLYTLVRGTDTVETSQGQTASLSAAVSGTGSAPDRLALDAVYLGQVFADLDPASSSSNTSLDIVYLAEPLGTTGTAPAPLDATVTTSQAQHSLAVPALDTVISSGQAQSASAAVQVSWPGAVATSQGQSASAQVALFTPWTQVSCTRNDSDITGYAFPSFALAAGDHVVVSVFSSEYTNPTDGSANTNPDRAWTLAISDTAGNSYVALTPVRDQVIIGYPQFSVAWVYQFYCVNAFGSASNVITVTPVSHPSDVYDATPPRLVSTATVLSSSGKVAEFDASAGAGSTTNSTASLSLPAMTVQPGAVVLYDAIGNATSSSDTASGWTLVDNFYDAWRTYWRANNQSGTQNTTVTGDGGIRVLSAVSLRNAQGNLATTRQAQTSSAVAGVISPSVDSTATTGQGQHSAASGAVAAGITATTSQAQHAAASAGGDLLLAATTSQGQHSSAEAGVDSTADVASAQAQAASAEAGVALDTGGTSAQAQGSSGELGLSVDAAAATAGVQQATGQLAAAYVADVASGQVQHSDALAGLSLSVQVTLSQAQGSSLEGGVAADTVAATGQAQRTRAQIRGESVNTIESGQRQVVGGQLGVASLLTVATRQGQRGALLAGVAVDVQVVAGQVQHIGDGNRLVVGVDVVVTTAQARQHAAGVLEHYIPRPGTLSVGVKRLHPSLAGSATAQPALDAPTRVRTALSGRVDLRPD